MQLTTIGVFWINLVAQTITCRLAEEIEINKQNQPLYDQEQQREQEESIFIANLTANDSNIDQGLGRKVAYFIAKQFYEQSSENAKQKFNQIVSAQKKNFQKALFVTEMENQCLKIIEEEQKEQAELILNEQKDELIKKLVQFYMDPKKFLEDSFQQKFNEVFQDKIQDCQEQFKKEYNQQIEKVEDYFKKFLQDLKNKKADNIAKQLFNWNSQSQIEREVVEKENKYEKLSVTYYFKSVLNKQWEYKQLIKFKEDTVCMEQTTILPHQDNLSPLDDNVIKVIQDTIQDTDKISQLHKFFEAIINKLNDLKVSEELEDQQIDQSQIYNLEDNQIKEQNQINFDYQADNQENNIQNQSNQASQLQKQAAFKIISSQNLIQEQKQNLKRSFMGCYEHCPLCRRQCDEVHNDNASSSQKHQCSQGHQMQCFGGQKEDKTNNAIHLNCNELKNDQIIIYNGQENKWSRLKNMKFINWSFDKDKNDKGENLLKNLKIWNFIGEQLCSQYLKECNITINFQEQICSNHYILMLDDSGSMNPSPMNSTPMNSKFQLFKSFAQDIILKHYDLKKKPDPLSPWDQLMGAFKKFIKKLSSTKYLMETSKITVINYNSKAQITFKEQKPDIELADRIPFRSGGTNFNEPLKTAFDVCKTSEGKYDKFVLYFMSDGESDVPEEGINLLKSDQTIFDKIQFHCVAFGNNAGTETLKEIITKMGKGQMEEAKDLESLVDSIEKIVINPYDDHK